MKKQPRMLKDGCRANIQNKQNIFCTAALTTPSEDPLVGRSVFISVTQMRTLHLFFLFKLLHYFDATTSTASSLFTRIGGRRSMTKSRHFIFCWLCGYIASIYMIELLYRKSLNLVSGGKARRGFLPFVNPTVPVVVGSHLSLAHVSRSSFKLAGSVWKNSCICVIT